MDRLGRAKEGRKQVPKQKGGETIGEEQDDNRANQLNPDHPAYWKSRGFDGVPETTGDHPKPPEDKAETDDETSEDEPEAPEEDTESDDKTPMTTEAARRIQKHVDEHDGDEEWKARAMSAAAKNEKEDPEE